MTGSDQMEGVNNYGGQFLFFYCFLAQSLETLEVLWFYMQNQISTQVEGLLDVQF